jgi:hypothetical protein
VGAALLCGVPWALADCGSSPGSATPAPDLALESPIMAAERRALPPVSPGAPTYPIPPEVLVHEASRRNVNLTVARAAPPAPGTERHNAGKPNVQPLRDEAEARRGPVASRVDRRLGGARRVPSSATNRVPSAPATTPGNPSSVVLHTTTETTMPPGPTIPESKARVPLVDDQPRVHILE